MGKLLSEVDQLLGVLQKAVNRASPLFSRVEGLTGVGGDVHLACGSIRLVAEGGPGTWW